jgi:hypothetical protein
MGKMKNAYKMMIGRRERKRPRLGWEDNIKMVVTDRGTSARLS